MRDHTVLTIVPNTIARTPRHVGVNVELQEHADRTNLWDWLADSGVSVAREFHPEVSFRTGPAEAGDYGDLPDRQAFDAYRKRVNQDPAGAVGWDRYRFAQSIPWMGVPDAIAAKVHALGIEPLYSLGYHTKLFPRPLIRDVSFVGAAGDDMIDWAAAACAYEYYFAVIHRYATRQGGRYFMMINEPENQLGWFHMPAEFSDLHPKRDWARLSWDDDQPSPVGARYFDLLATQYGVMARLARLALEDVRTLLGGEPHAAYLHLSGPTNVVWKPLWDKAAPYLDALDYHHYHPDASTFRQTYEAVAARAGASGRNVAITEFNRYSGGTPIGYNLFSMGNALGMADLVMTVLGLAAPTGPVLEFIALYVLHFPSTHRNYKHLLYGDMNVVDWSGTDTPLWNRGEAWYPTFEEQQARFATPAYHLFRMLNRCVSYGAVRHGPHAVLPVGFSNPTSAAPHDIHDQLRVLAVRQPGQMIVTILNASDRPARNCYVDLSLLPEAHRYRWAVVRRTTQRERDQVVAQTRCGEGPVHVDVPSQCMTQVILTELELDRVTPVALREASITPGGVGGLDLHQTTRLRAIGSLDGRDVDVTDVCVVWSSSDAGTVRVEQGGLVQRVRRGGGAVQVGAGTLMDQHWPSVTIPAPG